MFAHILSPVTAFIALHLYRDTFSFLWNWPGILINILACWSAIWISFYIMDRVIPDSFIYLMSFQLCLHIHTVYCVLLNIFSLFTLLSTPTSVNFVAMTSWHGKSYMLLTRNKDTTMTLISANTIILFLAPHLSLATHTLLIYFGSSPYMYSMCLALCPSRLLIYLFYLWHSVMLLLEYLHMLYCYWWWYQHTS